MTPWDTSPARTISTTVWVDGANRDHESVTWEQDITSDLPDTVSAGGRVAQRTGTIVWANSGVSTRVDTGWAPTARWLPTVGQLVQIHVLDGQVNNRIMVFLGYIDTVEGDAFGRLTSKIIATVRASDRVIRRQALTHTGALLSGDVGYLATTPVWVVHEIARTLGYHSVPPEKPISTRILDAPLQGSTYIYSSPTVYNARLVRSTANNSSTNRPGWASGPDGFGLTNATLEWERGTGGGTGAGRVGASMVVFSAHSATATLTVDHGATDYLRVTVNADRRVLATTNVGASSYSRFVGDVPATPGPHVISVIAQDGALSVRMNGDTTTVDGFATPPGAVTGIRLAASDGACVAGVQVWAPTFSTDHAASQLWTPSARYRYGAGTGHTTIAPAVRDERAGDVLDDYAAALLSPIWIDGTGTMQVVTGQALHEQATAVEVDALRDVSELTYKTTLLGQHPRVEVTYQHTTITAENAATARTTVWQDRGGALTPHEPDEQFVTVPDDEEWVGLADPAAATRLTNGNVAAFNAQAGSWWGITEDYTYKNAAGDDVDAERISALGSQVVETLTPWAWKVTTSTTSEDLSQKVADVPAVRRMLRGTGLPVWRARSRVQYKDRTTSVGSGQTLVHETGKWVTTDEEAQRLRDWLHGMTADPAPVLENLVLRFDPRVDVGVVITIRAQEVFGVDFQALVLAVTQNPYDGTTRVDARVTKVTDYAPTLDGVDYAHIGQTLTQWDQARAGKTLAQVAADPYTL